MRILLLTDSLGCPGKGIDASDIWTEKVLKKWANDKTTVYTYCKHGLSAKMIDMEYVEELSPDIIIIQIGIVDACRRALSKTEVAVIRRIPGIGHLVREFCGNHHYFMSKKRKIHYCAPDTFKDILSTIASYSRKACIFISIAPPGKELEERIYNVQNDVKEYNRALKHIQDARFIEPYIESDMGSLLLNDGHHLTKAGHNLVYKAVEDAIRPLLGGTE